MSLLDDIAGLVMDGLDQADMLKPATLIKIAPGTRTPGAISAGTNPTTTSYAVKAVPGSLTGMRIQGLLISGVDRVIKILGASLPAGVTPVPGDKITMDGATVVIVGDSGGNQAVVADAARAAWVCQCRT